MFDIATALRTLVEREGSDLHVKIDSPPVARMHGDLIPLEGFGKLSAEDTKQAFHDIAEPRSLTEFEADGEADFSYALPGVSRFRVNVFKPARVDLDRLPRDPLPDPLDRRPRAARRGPRAGRGAARDRPRHRHHRLRQEHHAGGDDRPHQRDPGAAHHHARGPDRVPARGQELDRQPARSRLRHGRLRPRDAARPAPGPGRDPDRRDARRGDRAHGALGGRDRPPRALHRPHPGRDRDDQPDHRLLPAAPAATGAGDAGGDLEGRDRPAPGPRPDRRGPRPRLRGDGGHRPGPGPDHEPGGNRQDHRGHLGRRVLRDADLRPGPAHLRRRRAGSPRRWRWSTPPTRTT